MTAALDIKNLSLAFGGLKAVSDFSMSLPKGCLYGLIGPNGAGKTTVFNLLTGVYKPDTGGVELGADLGVAVVLARPADAPVVGEPQAQAHADERLEVTGVWVVAAGAGDDFAAVGAAHGRGLPVNRTRKVIIGLALLASVAFPFPDHEMNAGRVTASADRPTTVTGRLTDEGVECQALRSSDGTLYTLVGELRGFVVGDFVTVVGEPVEVSTCMQGTTLQVHAIRKAEPTP